MSSFAKSSVIPEKSELKIYHSTILPKKTVDNMDPKQKF